MTLPNADRAAIDPTKVRSYLLSQLHAVGRFKATFFVALGYSENRWELLRDDLLKLALVGAAAATAAKPSLFGQTFVVDGILTGPSGRSAEVRTIWIIRATEDSPRFVTAFPR